MIYALTLVLAFCSIVYELLLGQALAAFLGGTVLRFSVTIGLYMLSMGIGAILTGRRLLRRPVLSLQGVEALLTLIGAGSVPLLFLVDGAGAPVLVLSVIAHSLIVVIGILTGIELPLLIELQNRRREGSEGRVLGVDYAGAFLGTVLFAFVFYPRTGLVATAFLVAGLNAAAGLAAGAGHRGTGDAALRPDSRLLGVQAVLLAGAAAALLLADPVSETLVGIYLGGGAS